jgi:hypothetical protein
MYYENFTLYNDIVWSHPNFRKFQEREGALPRWLLGEPDNMFIRENGDYTVLGDQARNRIRYDVVDALNFVKRKYVSQFLETTIDQYPIELYKIWSPGFTEDTLIRKFYDWETFRNTLILQWLLAKSTYFIFSQQTKGRQADKVRVTTIKKCARITINHLKKIFYVGALRHQSYYLPKVRSYKDDHQINLGEYKSHLSTNSDNLDKSLAKKILKNSGYLQ